MALRKWLVRSVVFTITGAIAAAALAYQHWTNPAKIRLQVIKGLSEHLSGKVGATVSLDSAQLNLLWGISFKELRLARRDDPNQVDFAYVPSGTIYHDKEKLVGGELVIRKIEWYRPTLRVIRRRDGTWNLGNILSMPDLKMPVPTIELQNATFLVEDERGGPDYPPLKVKDVNLTIINNPAPLWLQFKGSGKTELAGEVDISGSLSRKTDEIECSIQVPKFAVEGNLLQRLAGYYPEAVAHARQLTGSGSLDVHFRHGPLETDTWSHDVMFQLRDGKWTHAQLPMALEHIEARLRCLDDQIRLEQFNARAGTALVQLTGKSLSLSDDADIEGNLKIGHLHVSPELLSRLPASLHEILDYDPRGDFSMTLEMRRHSGHWYRHCVIHPEGMTCVCKRFSYKLENVTGYIDHEDNPFTTPKLVDRYAIKLVGYTGSQPVFVEGTIEGERPAGVHIKIWGDNIPLDQKLCDALETRFQNIVRSFSPTGFASIEAQIERGQGNSEFANRYIARFHDTTLHYDIFPYPIENVTGTLDIEPDHWEYRDFHGSHKGAEFFSYGRSVPEGKGNHLHLEINGKRILLDPELEGALTKKPNLKLAWKKLAPSGRMDFSAHVDIPPGEKEEPDIGVDVTPLGATIHPEFFPCDLTEVRGAIEYRKEEVKLKNLSTRHGLTTLTLKEGKICLNPNGDVSLDLTRLLGNYIVLDAEMERALPPALGKACAALQLKDPVWLATDMTINIPADHSPPYIYWDGGLRLKNAAIHAGLKLEHVNGVVFCRGQHQGTFGRVLGNIQLDDATIMQQPFQGIEGQIIVGEKEPDLLQLPNLRARLFGGDVAGAVRMQFGTTPRYEVYLQASQIRLEEFGRNNHLGADARLEGQASARVYLRGQGTDLDGLEGEGSFDVPSGKMYHLPLLLDLMKFLNLRLPDGTAFDEAHARFTVHGPRVEITRLDLLGSAISFGGKGAVNLESNDINMELYAVWARAVQISPRILKDFWPELGKFLLKIKMSGRIGEAPRFEKEPVPVLVEPIKDLLQHMSRSGQGG